MSAPEKLDTRARLLGYSRWAAIGLAVLAALTLALSSGVTALRIAAFMAVIAVVLVVASITLNGASSTKVHLEEVLLDEIDMLRDDVRADITTAARATHRALAERVAHLHQNIETMRRDVDSRAIGEAAPLRPGLAATPPRRALPAPAGVVHHTETVHVTTHQTYVDPAETERAERFVQRPPTWRPERPDRDDRGDWDRDARARAGAESAWTDDRRPYADRDDQRDDRRPYADYADRDDAARRRSVPSARPPAREDAWSDSQPRDYPAPAADLYDDSSEIAAWRNSRPLDRDDDPADDDRWSAMRSGDRWAEVRTDERGRELRMGERRTAIRADETGTQMRIVDRWSTVRRENPRPDRTYDDDDRGYDVGPSSGAGFRSGSDNTGETRSERRRREEAEAESTGRRGDESRRGGSDSSWASSERSRLALPSAGPESAAGWIRGRDDHADEDRVGRRRSHEISGEVVRPGRSAEPIGRGGSVARPDSRTADARGSDLRGSDFRGSDFRGSDYRGSDYRASSDARGADGSDARDSRGGDSRGGDSRGGDSRGADPRSSDAHGSDDRWPETGRPSLRGGADRGRPDPRGADPRPVEPRGGEPRGGEPRGSEPRGSELRGSELRGSEPRGGERRSRESREIEPRGIDYRSDPRGPEPRGGADLRGGPERRGGLEPRGALEPRGGVEPRGGIEPRGGDRRGGEPPWSAPRRPEPRDARIPEARPQGRDAGPASRDYPPDEDNRWEREPSGGRSAVQRRAEFDPNDDRWR